jgi:hypothetical protein
MASCFLARAASIFNLHASGNQILYFPLSCKSTATRAEAGLQSTRERGHRRSE